MVVGGDHHDRLAQRAHLGELGERDAACAAGRRGRGGEDMRCSFAWLTPASRGRHRSGSRTLSIRRTAPTRAATATSARPSTVSSGSKVSGSTSARYSGSTSPSVGAARRRATRVGVALAGGDRVRGGAQRAARAPSARARSSASSRDVAARQREPVRLAHGRARPRSATGMSRSRDHPPSDRDLLGVLLAEVGDVGRDDVEQLARRRCRRRRSGPGRARRPRAPRRGPSTLHAWWRSRRGRSRSPAGRTGRRRRARAASAASRPRCAGRRRGRAASLNCAGLTNSETTTSSQRSRAARISAWWPAWKAPIVGTSPTLRPAARASRRVRAHLGDRCGSSSCRRRQPPRARGGRRARRTAASSSGARSCDRRALARDRRLVAAGDRAGQRRLGARARPSCSTAARDERGEQRAVDAGGGGQPLGRALQRDEEVRRRSRRRRGRRRGPRRRRAWRACPSRCGQRLARPRARAACVPSTAQPAPREDARARAGRARSSAGAGEKRLVAGRATSRPVAPEQWPTQRPGGTARGRRGDLAVGHAQQHDVGAGGVARRGRAGPSTASAGGAQRRGRAAGADDGAGRR